MSDQDSAYDELYVYTMSRPNFILQHVVDAKAAQTATVDSGAMGLVFALVGLYLHLEKGFTGSQVQRVHQTLSRQKQKWPSIDLPLERGRMTAAEVMRVPAGDERDVAIDRWCDEVWRAFHGARATIVQLLAANKIA